MDALREASARYYVPATTLSSARATELGIHTKDDLFGGVVPHAFVATKVISHPLVRADSKALSGWNPDLGDALADVTLPGFSVFSVTDAALAGREILRLGSARLKMACGIGGQDQEVVEDEAQLDHALARVSSDGWDGGMVVELNLKTHVKTFSVGAVSTAGQEIAYLGQQFLTPNAAGELVYGGSQLMVIRGQLEDLCVAFQTPRLRKIADLAQRYDRTVQRAYPGTLLSRRNYDVISGVDESGQSREGVLEQSWRVGGATPAELAAIDLFAANSSASYVAATTIERYHQLNPPRGAEVICSVDDPNTGRLTKLRFAKAISRFSAEYLLMGGPSRE